MNSKLPSQKSLNELLADLDNPEIEDKAPQDDYSTELARFLAYYQILPGTHSVNTASIYRLYRIWSSQPMTRASFCVLMYALLGHGAKAQCVDISLDHIQVADELLTAVAAKRLSKPTSKAYKAHFDRFLLDHLIYANNPKAKVVWVSVSVLYYMYMQWRKTAKVFRKLTYREFIIYCKLYFPCINTGGIASHTVGIQIFINNRHLTYDNQQRIINFVKQHPELFNEKNEVLKKKKKNKKKRKKVSRTRQKRQPSQPPGT